MKASNFRFETDERGVKTVVWDTDDGETHHCLDTPEAVRTAFGLRGWAVVQDRVFRFLLRMNDWLFLKRPKK